MNVSGGPVAGLLRYYGVAPADLLVVHDDLDLGFGVVRLKQGGGEGGHNGLRSISASIGTKDYLRVRFGIGRPPGRQDPADFVLKRFSGAERKELEFAVGLAGAAAEARLHAGLESAQNRFHALPGCPTDYAPSSARGLVFRSMVALLPPARSKPTMLPPPAPAEA